MEFKNINDLALCTNHCNEEKIISRIREYSIEEFKVAEYKVDNIILKSQKAGIRIVTYFDELFPTRLKEMTVGNKILSPLVLYYKRNIQIVSMPAVAIIGSRKLTKEGIISGEYLR